MSHSNRRVHDLQQLFVRQAVILRGNLQELDHQLHVGDNWQSMLGRLNAAASQTSYVDQNIEDALDHFAVEPKKCLINPSDVPVFLSVRIVDDDTTGGNHLDSHAAAGDKTENRSSENHGKVKSSTEHLQKYERDAAVFATEFEANMVRF